MDAQMKRGLLEACVLSLLTKGDSYGYLLIQEVSALMPISESTLYPVLRRLESAGHLTVYSREHNGRLRKYYRITEAGRGRIEDFKEDWKELLSIYQFVTKEDEGCDET